MAHFNSSGYWFNLRETFLLYCVFVLRFLWRAMFGVYVFGFYLANLCNWFLNSTLVFFWGARVFIFRDLFLWNFHFHFLHCYFSWGISDESGSPFYCQ